MAFKSALVVQLLNDREKFPWVTLAPLEYECELTGETYVVPRYFRTDGASLPAALVAVPGVGSALFLRYFGQGVFQGFKQGVLHDWLRRGPNPPVPAAVAHRIFRAALYEADYPGDLCETYYEAVRLFNS
jgi:hypothetical protein